MRIRWTVAGGVVLVSMLVASAPALAQKDPPETPAGFRVDPAGVEFGIPQEASGFQGPMGAALSPDGKLLLAASSGASQLQSADLFDIDAQTRTSAVYYPASTTQSVFYGVAWSPDGTRAWMSGAGQRVVHVLDLKDGVLTETGTIPTTGFAAGLAYGVTPHGPRLYVVNNAVTPFGRVRSGHTVTVIDPATSTVLKDIDLGPAAAPYGNAPHAGIAQPLGVAFARDGRTAIVTDWMERSISVIDTDTETAAPPVRLSSDPAGGDHPSAVAANPVRDEAYVADSNSDTVSVVDSRDGTPLATIPVGLVPNGPKGSLPDALAVSPDGATLYVALAGENSVAVVDVDSRAVRGFIPTSWYPSDVEVTPDGKRLVITNANDSGAGPNVCGPNSPLPDCPKPTPESQQAGRMIKGSVQVVDVPSAGTLDAYTAAVRRNNRAQNAGREMPAALSAIKHVFYVIKENRTYDQVFGDLPGGNGDPDLVIFGQDSAPNQRDLARRFGLFDNFYADAEVTADGHNWATQAASTDYVDKMWPFNYSPSKRNGTREFDFGNDVAWPDELLASDPSIWRPAASQTAGYLWDDAAAHGVTVRDYGEYSTGDSCDPGTNPSTSLVTHLKTPDFETVDQGFLGFNLGCSDHAVRIPEWKSDFDGFVRDGNLPALNIIRLGSDHTQGTKVGSATPQSYMADNDLAVGELVDAISHSPYWKDSAIFVTEDDAQDGPDHVDAHRTMALVVSAYNKRHPVDSTHYDTGSMVGTIEDLLGLPPMSITDARVTRMWKAFTDEPDLTPYDASMPAVIPFGEPGAPVNGAAAPLAAESATWDFSREDAAPEVALNEAIWKSVKGKASKMPAPKHEHIIGSTPTDEGD
jgi:YVTN family beta-propeller protein